MNRRDFIRIAGIGAIGVSVGLPLYAKTKPRKLPNIIYILADDQLLRS